MYIKGSVYLLNHINEGRYGRTVYLTQTYTDLHSPAAYWRVSVDVCVTPPMLVSRETHR